MVRSYPARVIIWARFAKLAIRYGLRILRRPFAAVAVSMLGTITHVSTQDPVIALTFDEGPHPEFTHRLLDILEGYQARATFFCVGKFAQRHSDAVRRAAQAGHCIGNHSWDHPSFRLISRRERREQIRECADALAPYEQRFFRPPYGHQSIASRFDAFVLGYEVIGWNLVACDWLDHHADRMAEQLVNQIQPGSVVLLHDRILSAPEERYFDRKPMLEAVKIVLGRLNDSFRFVTIPELLRHGRPQRQNWYWEADVDWLNTLQEEEGGGRRYT